MKKNPYLEIRISHALAKYFKAISFHYVAIMESHGGASLPECKIAMRLFR